MSDTQQPVVAKQPEPIWAIVANVREEIPYGPGQQETRRGTKKFNAGAKVYLVGISWKSPAENRRVSVIGHYRGGRYVRTILPAWCLTDYRVELVYSPSLKTLLAKRPQWTEGIGNWKSASSPEVKAYAEDITKRLTQNSDEYYTKRLLRRTAFKEEQEKDQSEGQENP